MRRLAFALLGLILLANCHSRLLGDRDSASEPNPPVIVGGPNNPAGSCPEIETPNGYTTTPYYGVLHTTYDVQIANEPSSTVWVLIRDVGTWFKLGTSESGAYWYQRIDATTIRYRGPFLESKEYCVFEFVPGP